MNPDSLPVARRVRRDQMRALLAQRYGATPDTTLGPMRTKWDGLVLDYNSRSPSPDNLVGGATYQFSMGAQVAGGALEVGMRSLGTLDYGRFGVCGHLEGRLDRQQIRQATDPRDRLPSPGRATPASAVSR